MSRNSAQKLSFIKKALITGLLIFCFGSMSGFSYYLHAHEFDLTEVEEDCAPCQWTQNNFGLDQEFSTFDFIPVGFTHESIASTKPKQNFKYTFFGLSPPLFS